MKYEMIAISVQIGGILYKKEDAPIFDAAGKHKVFAPELEALAEKGFLKKVEKIEPVVKNKRKK